MQLLINIKMEVKKELYNKKLLPIINLYCSFIGARGILYKSSIGKGLKNGVKIKNEKFE